MFLIVGTALVTAAAVALECPVKVVLQKAYRLVDGEGEDVGSYTVDFDSYDDDIIMVEELEAAFGDKRAGYSSSVTFSPDVDGLMRPTKATAATSVDGETCMTGTVTFEEKTWQFYCKGLRNKRTGEPIVPPRVYEKDDLPMLDKLIVFPQALVYMGPIWLPEDGEMAVVIAEFPDDLGAPELIEFKTDARLSRRVFDDEGGFAIELFKTQQDPEQFEGTKESLAARVEYDDQGDVVSTKLFPRWRMVERDEDDEADKAVESNEIRKAREAHAAAEAALKVLREQAAEAESTESEETDE